MNYKIPAASFEANVIDLAEGWFFKQADAPDAEWLPTKIPTKYAPGRFRMYAKSHS